MLVEESNGGAAAVRAQRGDIWEAPWQPQAARRARRAHVLRDAGQAQREASASCSLLRQTPVLFNIFLQNKIRNDAAEIQSYKGESNTMTACTTILRKLGKIMECETLSTMYLFRCRREWCQQPPRRA